MSGKHRDNERSVIRDAGKRAMVTCLDCAWHPLCDPPSIHQPCPDFISPETLGRKASRELYEELVSHRKRQSDESLGIEKVGGADEKHRNGL